MLCCKTKTCVQKPADWFYPYLLLMVLSLIFMIPGYPTKAQGQQPKEIEGRWRGLLKTPNADLRIILEITGNNRNSYSATMYSLDQSPAGIPAGSVEHDSDTLYITFPSIGGSYHGYVVSSGQKIAGKWKQMGSSFPLELKRAKGKTYPVEPQRPQEPRKPYPYRSEEVYFESRDGVKLAGTLTMPRSSPPYPGVVLIAGSGPMNRNSAVHGHRPFLVLSDHLTRHGIAVLRFDKRGTGESAGYFGEATVKDFVEDASAAFQYFVRRQEIDIGRTGLIGHSEGGLIAPRVANKTDEVDFLILLAAPGVKGEEILYRQTELISRTEGVGDSIIAAAKKRQQQLFDIVQCKRDDEKTVTALDSVLSSMGLTRPARQKQIQKLTSPWFRWFLSYDPIPALKKAGIPIFALGGEKDLQVPPEPNLRMIEETLVKERHERFSVRTLEGLNHLFQSASTGLPTEYSRIEETMSPILLKTVENWIKDLTAESRKTE